MCTEAILAKDPLHQCIPYESLKQPLSTSALQPSSGLGNKTGKYLLGLLVPSIRRLAEALDGDVENGVLQSSPPVPDSFVFLLCLFIYARDEKLGLEFIFPFFQLHSLAL